MRDSETFAQPLFLKERTCGKPLAATCLLHEEFFKQLLEIRIYVFAMIVKLCSVTERAYINNSVF